LLLNVLLTASVSFETSRAEHFWAHIPPAEGTSGYGEIRSLQRFYFAPLNAVVADALSPPAPERLVEVEPETYYTSLGHDGNPLRIPADLDESLCRYRELSEADRAKFDRAAFWLDIAARQWTISMSASFASLVTAIEALTHGSGPGATERFRSFFETFAPGATVRERGSKMYRLRSDILHGSDLMQMDQDLAFGWDPPGSNEGDLHRELWSITSLALRNWLKNPAAHPPAPGEKILSGFGYLRGKAERVWTRLFPL
jgi:Apea-like HEPN